MGLELTVISRSQSAARKIRTKPAACSTTCWNWRRSKMMESGPMSHGPISRRAGRFLLPPLDAIQGAHVALEYSGVSEEISAVEIQAACTSGQGNARRTGRQAEL